MACLAVLLLWPASAAAEIGRCLEVSDLAERGIHSFMRSTSSDSDTDEFQAGEFYTGEFHTVEFHTSALDTSPADDAPKETPASVDSETHAAMIRTPTRPRIFVSRTPKARSRPCRRFWRGGEENRPPVRSSIR